VLVSERFARPPYSELQAWALKSETFERLTKTGLWPTFQGGVTSAHRPKTEAEESAQDAAPRTVGSSERWHQSCAALEAKEVAAMSESYQRTRAEEAAGAMSANCQICHAGAAVEVTSVSYQRVHVGEAAEETSASYQRQRERWEAAAKSARRLRNGGAATFAPRYRMSQIALSAKYPQKPLHEQFEHPLR
jgi:hypothetical protein